MTSKTPSDTAPIVVASDSDMGTTLERLRSAATDRSFGVAATVDHAAGAAKIGQDLRPTTLLVFGNPTVGTALMQQTQTFGLDLPLKVLVFEDDAGAVQVAYPSLPGLAQAHGLPADHPEIVRVNGVLTAIVGETAGGS